MKRLLNSVFLTGVLVLLQILLFSGCEKPATENEQVKAIETTPEEQSKALQAADSFLNKLDKDNFDTWDNLSFIIKSGSSKKEWISLTQTIRTTSGKYIERDLSGWTCIESLPGAPMGRYFVFDYKSVFKKMELIERVVVALENNRWMIAGYHTTKEMPQSV